MRQIILVSRIHAHGDAEEFSKYTDGDETALTINGGGGTVLLLIKGSSLRSSASKPDAIYDEVNQQGLDKEADTIIAYHYEFQIEAALRNRFTQGGWTKITDVKQYGSGGDEAGNPLYEILNAMGAAIKAGHPVTQLVERLWQYLAHDPELEAKLKLLQMIVNGETHRASGEPPFKLDPIIEEFQSAFEEFSRKDVDIFGLLKDPQVTHERKQQVFNEYREAFEKFHGALDVEYHA